MAVGDKNYLLVTVSTNLPDNTSGLITPASVRTVDGKIVTYSLNQAELAPQTVAGPVNYTGALTKNGLPVWYMTKAKIVNSLADFPAPVGGIITLLTSTTYLMGNDVNVGTNRFVFNDRSIIRGIESLNITLTYTGNGDLFTMSDVTAHVSTLTIAAASGRLFNWTSTSGLELRVTDIQSASASFGVFNGSASRIRFTNISPIVSTTGVLFTGTWDSALWEVSGANINGGVFFDLGTATFKSILVDKTFMILGAGTTFISGLPNSGNIQTGGLGTVLLTRVFGVGTVLSGISTGDASWDFFHNNEIPDSRPDLLLSMQNNATTTVITTDTIDGTGAVLAAGIWTEQSASQMSGTAGGRSTYNGGKGAKLPVTYSVSIAPVSGTNIKLSAYIAVNGVVQVGSRRQGTASGGSPTSISIPWQESFDTGDFHEVYLENNQTTSNILMSSAISRTN